MIMVNIIFTSFASVKRSPAIFLQKNQSQTKVIQKET